MPEERPVGGEPGADRRRQAAALEARHGRRRRADARARRRVEHRASRLGVAGERTSAPTVVSAWSMLTRLPAP